MSVGAFLKNSGWAALAAAMVVSALPAPAFAQDRGQDRGRGERSERTAQQPRNGVQQRQQMGQQAQARQAQQRQTQQRQAQARPVQPRQQQAQRAERRPDQRPAGAQAAPRGDQRQARQNDWRNDRRPQQARPRDNQRDNQRADAAQRRGDWRADRTERNRSYTDPRRNPTYRTDRRDDNRWRGDQARPDRQAYRQWDRRWRNDNRYDWQRHRTSNRVTFRLGSYYAPYRNYSYRPLSIGGRLDSLFFGSNYWINDPWQYRLPAVYGPYRWVRYYNDVLLVDTFSGEVVDVIHDFFW